MQNIAIIATDKELFDLAKSVVRKRKDSISVAEANYDNCLDCAEKLVKNGAKVLISRGGYTYKLRNTGIGVPVIDIPISGYNVAIMLAQAREIFKRIAVVGFEDLGLVKGVESLAPILGLDVKYFMVKSDSEINQQVIEARNQGFKVVVGGYMAAAQAQELGMASFFVKSNRDEVEQALFEAGKVLDALRKEREWGEKFETILDSIDDSVIFIDREERIIHCNGALGKLLGISSASVLGKQIRDVIKDQKFGKRIKQPSQRFGEIYEVRGLNYVCNLVPVEISGEVIGTVATFQEVGYLQNVEQNIRRNLYHKGHVTKYSFEDIIGQSKAIKRIIEQARQYARVDSTILIMGETGTGKEILAQSIHNLSSRRMGPFVAVNCTSIPENLLEAELFGYVEGAFTGAKKSGKLGFFELAHNGTIFLDEIGEISLNMQSRLLRVLEERQIIRIGDDKILPINIRIIAATNKDLRNLIQKGQFREDLYYRLNTLNLSLPPLRERKEDIPLLARNFLDKVALDYGKQVLSLTGDVLSMLMEYDWPGNIRELRNVMERIVITFPGIKINREKVFQVLGEACSINNESSLQAEEMSLVKRQEIESIKKSLS